jgi:hypothetical protein
MKREPIKPHKSFTKKYNFKTEKLDVNYFNQCDGEIDLTQFRSPGVFTRVIDTSTINFNRDVFIPNREPNNNGRIYNINVGNIDSNEDLEYFIRRMRESLRVPPRYLSNQPIGVSSRQRENPDGSLDLIGYDLVTEPKPWSVLSGRQLNYDASTTMILKNPSKKSFINWCINKIKNLFNRKKK